MSHFFYVFLIAGEGIFELWSYFQSHSLFRVAERRKVSRLSVVGRIVNPSQPQRLQKSLRNLKNSVPVFPAVMALATCDGETTQKAWYEIC
jgi:hypothetical protein